MNKKPLKYIYNKDMLKKIKVVDGDIRQNEMEMKNYAEEVDFYVNNNQ